MIYEASGGGGGAFQGDAGERRGGARCMNITNSTLPWVGGSLVRVNQLPRGGRGDRGGGRAGDRRGGRVYLECNPIRG